MGSPSRSRRHVLRGLHAQLDPAQGKLNKFEGQTRTAGIVAAHLRSLGIEVRTGTPQAAQAFIEGQIDTWARVVREHGIKAD